MRALGWSLILEPTIMSCILTSGAFAEPRLLVDYWDVYLLFIGLPYATGGALLWRSRKQRPVEKPE
jgi:hypothetical protein